MEEIWKRIPEYSDYEVSNYGRVKSYKCKKIRLLRICPHKHGYNIVGVTDDNGRATTKGCHQLVALAFIGPCPRGMIVCHNDDNPSNNIPKNLRYDTHENNIYQAAVREHAAYSEDEITINLARAIKMDILAGMPYLEVAQKHSVTYLPVLKIANGELFREVHKEVSKLFLF